MVQEAFRIPRGKEFVKGKVSCDRGYTYTVVMENPSTLYPCRTVEYCIRAITK